MLKRKKKKEKIKDILKLPKRENTVSDKKYLLPRINSGFTNTKEKINKHEEIAIETFPTERKKTADQDKNQ